MDNKILPYKQLGNITSYNTLVFLHGSGMTKEGMIPFVNYFNNYNCIIFDLPNHGQAEESESKSILSFSKQVEKTILNLQDKNIISKKVVILGFSMGGAVAYQVALNKKVDLSGLIFLSSSADLANYSPLVKAIKGISLEQFDVASAVDALFGNIVTKERKAEIVDVLMKTATQPKVTFDDLMICGKYNELKRCSEIKIPTLLVQGDDDAVVSPMGAAETWKNIKGSELLLIPYGGHALIFEDSDCVSEKIIFFIKKLLENK